jgi:hypothetical protein
MSRGRQVASGDATCLLLASLTDELPEVDELGMNIDME